MKPIPTKYIKIKCELCGEITSCFSVLCTEKYQAAFISGSKSICLNCLKGGEEMKEEIKLRILANLTVDLAVETGKITFGQYTWARNYCFRDPEGFRNYIFGPPVPDEEMSCKNYFEATQAAMLRTEASERRIGQELGLAREILAEVKRYSKTGPIYPKGVDL